MNKKEIAIWMFKVKDYTNVLIGQKDPGGNYYVQRGDGTRYEYSSYNIIWSRYLGRFVAER